MNNVQTTTPSAINSKWTILKQLEWLKQYILENPTSTITEINYDGGSIVAIDEDNQRLLQYQATATMQDGTTKQIIITMPFNIKGSESIVVDIDETQTQFEIHLDADILADIERSLKIPMNAPEKVKVVGINTNNAQVLLEPATKLYCHTIPLTESNGTPIGYLKIISTISTPFNCIADQFIKIDGTIEDIISSYYLNYQGSGNMLLLNVNYNLILTKNSNYFSYNQLVNGFDIYKSYFSDTVTEL